jgi:hypothetical protein
MGSCPRAVAESDFAQYEACLSPLGQSGLFALTPRLVLRS